MAASTSTVAWASLNGTLEIVSLCAAGAFLAHRGILHSKAVYTLSQVMVQLLIPSLMYFAMLEGFQAARDNFSPASIVDIFFPPLWGIVVLGIGLAVAAPFAMLLGRGKEKAVQRTILVCAMVGNGRSMPLLILSALCDNFEALHEDPRCTSRAAELVSMFCVTWNVIVWFPVFSYLVNAPDVVPDEEEALVQKRPPVDLQRPGLFSPMSLAVVLALGTASIPGLSEALLDQGGTLSSVFNAIRMMGNMVVPLSSIIVGAKLYSSRVKDTMISSSSMYVSPRKQFGFRTHMGILAVRLIVSPFIGRVLYHVFKIWQIPGDLLRVFSLIEFAGPTANNIVMVVVVMSQFLPNLGPQLEEDVATTVFYQYMTVPLFFTLNTALALNIVFNEEH